MIRRVRETLLLLFAALCVIRGEDHTYIVSDSLNFYPMPTLHFSGMPISECDRILKGASQNSTTEAASPLEVNECLGNGSSFRIFVSHTTVKFI